MRGQPAVGTDWAAGGTSAAGVAGAGCAWLVQAAQCAAGTAAIRHGHSRAQHSCWAAHRDCRCIPHPPTHAPPPAPPTHRCPLPAAGNFSSPTIVEWADDTVKVAYTVWGQGLKLASIKLATVESH